MTERLASSGEVLFARYAYPPNELGYCGTGDGAELLGAASGAENAEVALRARGFDGAWPYLQIIADTARISDPLDARVVEAYWIGNELLDAVDPSAFAREARRIFAGQTGADWHCLDPSPAARPLPHHSFHVLAIYPWMQLLRRGGGAKPLEVLDRCRIRWGEVMGVEGDHLDVVAQPLAWDGHRLSLGAPVPERVRWAAGGRSLQPAVAASRWVSLHWDWACDTLTAAQVAALRRFTLRQLEATNASAAVSDVAVSDVAGSDVAGSDVAVSDVAVSDVAGSDVAGSDVAGSDVAVPPGRRSG